METTENSTETLGPLDINQIMAILPHRSPFLLIDRVVEMVREKRIVAIKNVTMNEDFFVGHFPDYPIMPGVLVIEAMAQAGGVLLMSEGNNRATKLMLFTGIDSAKFRRAVTPGDQLRLEVDVIKWSHRGGQMQGKAYIDGKLACECIISCQLVPRPVVKPGPQG